MGVIVRETSDGAACSGDYYEGDDEPEPYLWQEGKLIRFTVYAYLFIIGVGILFSVIMILYGLIEHWLNKKEERGRANGPLAKQEELV